MNYEEKIIMDKPLDWQRNGVLWSHLVSSDIEYLKKFAVSIGLREAWVQVSAKGYVHFDIKSEIIRKRAIQKGAVLVESKYLLHYLQYHFNK